MNLWQGALTALESLSTHKLRSALTILGIVIGVAAVIALVSVGRGAQAQVTAQVESVGTNLLFVQPGSIQQAGVASAPGSAATLTLKDAEALYAVAGVVGVAPEVNGRAQVVYQGVNMNARVVGVTADYLTVRNYELADGEFISDANVTARSSVAVLGSGVAEALFGGTGGVVGQRVRLNGAAYRVIGVLVSKGGSGFGSQDDQVLVPLTTAQTRLLGTSRFRGANVISQITVKVASAGEVEQAIEGVTAVLRERHGTVEGEDDFSVQNQQDTLDAITAVTNTLTLFLGGIAAISLLVGGIGIMNIMLVSVTERTREIGIRKALGARRRDILYQFLVESAVLSFVGGLIGVAVGWLIASLVGRVQLGGSSIAPVVSVDSLVMATGFSIAVGLFFGIYPATRAAGLEPVEALRYE